jgi:16S rRNA (guanine966-N2)-methyltransferase
MGKSRHKRPRVIAGEYRGRILHYPADAAVRPTMERTREALFSAIQDQVRGAVFVDLFSAAGAVGIEALSRGAAEVNFVERMPGTLEHLERNLGGCGVAPGRFRIHRTDVHEFLARGGLAALPDAVVFADPPYGTDDGVQLLTHFRETAYANIKLLILEHPEPVGSTALGPLNFSKTRRYGDSHLSFWEQT